MAHAPSPTGGRSSLLSFKQLARQKSNYLSVVWLCCSPPLYWSAVLLIPAHIYLPVYSRVGVFKAILPFSLCVDSRLVLLHCRLPQFNPICLSSAFGILSFCFSLIRFSVSVNACNSTCMDAPLLFGPFYFVSVDSRWGPQKGGIQLRDPRTLTDTQSRGPQVRNLSRVTLKGG